MSETRAVHPVDEAMPPSRMVAYGLPEFYDEFPDAVRIIFESGSTAASGEPTAETTACMPTVEEV
jgi:hypothetical protein